MRNYIVTWPWAVKITAVFLLGVSVAQSQSPSCDKPYQRGHFTQLGTEDLRLDRHRAINKKELKEWDKKQEQAQSACNAFVSQHPNLPVSKDFSFTVKGFATVRERCESFCGSYEELMQIYARENK
jgi:hypothetical protein